MREENSAISSQRIKYCLSHTFCFCRPISMKIGAEARGSKLRTTKPTLTLGLPIPKAGLQSRKAGLHCSISSLNAEIQAADTERRASKPECRASERNSNIKRPASQMLTVLIQTDKSRASNAKIWYFTAES